MENEELEQASVGSFNLNFDEETPQESETESQYDEDVTILDEEGSVEELSEVEEELEELEELEEEVEQLDEEYDDEFADVSYTPFVEPLIEEGILYIDPDKDYDDSPEGFAEILQDTVQHQFQEMFSSLPEDAQRVIEVIQAGESLEAALDVFNSFDYSEVDLEDLDSQKLIVKELYEQRFPEWSTEKLNKFVQNLEDLGDLEEEAKLAQNALVEYTESQKQAYYEEVQARQQAQLEAQEEEINSYVQMIDEADGFNGIRFSSNKQREEFKAYTLSRGEDGLTDYERDTQDKQKQLALAYMAFTKQGTMDAIERRATTKASLAQQKVLKRLGQQDKNAKSGKSYADRQVRPKGDLYIPPIDWIS